MTSTTASPGGHGHHGHDDGDHAALFRDRFWLSLVLSLPVVFYSSMVQDWFGYSAPSFPGDGVVAPVLGTVVYLYTGTSSSPRPGRAARHGPRWPREESERALAELRAKGLAD